MRPPFTLSLLAAVSAVLLAGAAAPALQPPVLLAAGRGSGSGEAVTVKRPEPIVSMRIRIYSKDRYQELRDQWKAYTERRPKDPIGWVELARASRYAGEPCDDFVKLAEKALEIDPDCAEALSTVGSYRWKIYCPSMPEDPSESIRMLERALEIDPRLGEPHYTLWVMRLYQGKTGQAEEHLRAILNEGHVPEPLADYAYNMLVALEPDAILLTNGDNDTYPPLALQVARDFRKDVAVVNVSLLNTPWYRKIMKEGEHHVPLPEIDATKKITEPPAKTAVRGLLANLAADGWKRPLYVASTVYLGAVDIPNRLSLEGLVYRVLPEKAEGEEDAKGVNVERLRENLESTYRLESATSIGMDWEYYGAVGRLITNYTAGFARLAEALAASGDRAGARQAYLRALRLCDFHGQKEMGHDLAETWRKWDPDSAEASHWLMRFGG